MKECVSRVFSEFILVPMHALSDCSPSDISLKTPLVRFEKSNFPSVVLNSPIAMALSESDYKSEKYTHLAKEGGLVFVDSFEKIDNQAEIIRKIKQKYTRCETSKINLSPGDRIIDIYSVFKDYRCSFVPVTDDGTSSGILLGVLCLNDLNSRDCVNDTSLTVQTCMRKVNEIPCRQFPIDHYFIDYLNLPLLDSYNRFTVYDEETVAYGTSKDGHLLFVAKTDEDSLNSDSPCKVLDDKYRYAIGAIINNTDYEHRVPILIQSGVDVLLLDTDEDCVCRNYDVVKWVRGKYDNSVKIGVGSIIDQKTFRLFADIGVDFIKVGNVNSYGNILKENCCLGRGLASALIDISAERDAYYAEKSIYIPICAGGGLDREGYVPVAIAMGADFCILNTLFKNHTSTLEKLDESSVDFASYVMSISKLIRRIFCRTGSYSISEFRHNVKAELISPQLRQMLETSV